VTASTLATSWTVDARDLGDLMPDTLPDVEPDETLPETMPDVDAGDIPYEPGESEPEVLK
jgi:hypothetical protein